MRIIYFTLVVIFCCLLSFNQHLYAQTYYKDVVTLKDGSVYKGIILENTVNEKIKIKIIGENVVVIDYDNVVKIERVEVSPEIEPKTTGFFNHSLLGVNFGSRFDGSPVSGTGIRTTIGYRFKQNYAVGFGIGLEGVGGDVFFPTYIDGRYFLNENKISPFVYGQGGYSFPASGITNRYFGGVMFAGGIGIVNYLKNKTALTLSLGYHYQESKSEHRPWGSSQPLIRTDFYRRILFRVGFVFH